MKKLGLATALLSSLVMAGCAQTDIYSGSVYSGQQAKEARSISYGTIVSVRDVKIQAESPGAGSTVGGGSGRAIASAVGAIAGAMAGSTIEEKANQVSSLEMVIRKDDGKEIVVVQKKEDGFVAGKRVRIVGSNADLNVSLL